MLQRPKIKAQRELEFRGLRKQSARPFPPAFCWATGVLLGVIFFLIMPVANLNGQWIKPPDKLVGPFVDSEPFDVVYLNDDGDNAIMKVLPLGEKLPSGPLPDTGQLVFEYFAKGDDILEVPFSSISEIKTFNELLIEEAEQWLDEKDYAKAFRNLLYVYDHGGKGDRKLVATLKDCMFQDGRENFQNGEYELSLSIFEDVYQRDKDFKVEGFNQPLVGIIMSCYNGMIKKQFDRADYIGVRQTLQSVIDKYGEEADVLKDRWLKEFVKKSDDLIAQSRQLASQDKGREAHLAAKQAEQMSPGRPEVLELQGELLLQFPLIVVGINQTASDPDPGQIEHWGSRRIGHLTQRTLIELTGLSDEGGKYEFLNGRMYRSDEVGLRYTFEIKEDETAFAVPPINAFELSMRLLSLANEDSPAFDPAWAKILYDVEIEDDNVSVSLRTPYIRPESLLKMPYSNPDANGRPDQNGMYVLMNEDREFKTFELNPRYERKPNRQHPVIVEQDFSAASTAVDQLIAGNIDVVDRIPISDIARCKAAKGVEVRSYLLPTLHMLIPKIRGELATDSNFKNGLSHAIDRDLLVRDVMCGGKEIDGCEPVSGPFPIGTEENDQIAYGYDMRVRPMAFSSMLGGVMVQLSLRAQPPKRPDPLPAPTLVLAHPDSSSARNAASQIARMWSDIGVKTVTRELKNGESSPPDDEWDFLYAEVTVEEPMADAAKIIGPAGLAKTVSAPVEQTLRILSYAESWQSACSALRRLHRQVAVDLSVIPLWQVKEHYAFRTTIREIGRDLIHLYQNVDRWKIDLTAEEEQQEK